MLKNTKSILGLTALVLALSLTLSKPASAIPVFPSCDIPATFANTYLATGKASLSAQGFNPNFNSFTAPAVLFRNPDNPTVVQLYLGDDNGKFEVDPSWGGLQYGAKTTGTLTQFYRVIYNINGTVASSAKIGNGSTVYPASTASAWCVSGAKNLAGTTSAKADLTYKFPATDGLTTFGNASFDIPVANGSGGDSTSTEITDRDKKLIALALAAFVGFLLLKPFRFRGME